MFLWAVATIATMTTTLLVLCIALLVDMLVNPGPFALRRCVGDGAILLSPSPLTLVSRIPPGPFALRRCVGRGATLYAASPLLPYLLRLPRASWIYISRHLRITPLPTLPPCPVIQNL